MSDNVLKLKSDDLGDVKLSSLGTILVDFWAPWCGPCRTQGPILDQVSESIGDKAVVAKMNVDENPTVPAKFGVRSIPTLILFKDGKATAQFVGVTSKEKLVDAITASL